MHSGHYNAIRQAKSLCDVLVVGVHSDAEIQENKAMPVMRQAERYAILEHIKWVDEIVHDVPYSPSITTLENCRADFCVHGDDMPVNAQGVCAYDEMRECGRLKIVKRTEGVSTTDLIGRLLTLSKNRHSEDIRKHPLSPSKDGLGARISTEDAIEWCMATSQEQPSGAMAAALSTLKQMASTHDLPDGDVAVLRAQILACKPSSSSAQKPAAGNLGVEGVVRATAPVQLLASTRRITEFSTAGMPTKDDRVVYACGSFDMFHVGHAQFLKDAKALGTFLLVGIYDDTTVRDTKGDWCPVMNLNERVLNVCACKWVDEVIIGAPRDVTEDLMKTWNIHVVARGKDHMRNGPDASKITGNYAVPQKFGAYAEVPSAWPELCHGTVVRRIVESREQYLKRNRDRAHREDQYYAAKDTSSCPTET
jgi:ethanolamine-phosphate cytidylyltransferase